MKAPDKIFIPITPDCDIAVNDWSGVPLAQFDWKPVVENVCYIRKDVLLEWAREQIAENFGQYDNDWDLAFNELIDKINSI